MKLRFAKHWVRGALALAAITSASVANAADPSAPHVVSSEVVSDTVVGTSEYPTPNYVGDLNSETVIGDCSNGSCSTSDGSWSGNCQDGKCGIHGSAKGLLGNGLDGLAARMHGVGGADAGCQPRKYDRPDLFYNYYTQGNCNRANAQMYLSPVPVPHFVGHTFNTYQPFYPEEYLYWHKNRFHNEYDNGRGMNRTRAVYYAPPVRTFLSNLYWNKLRIPR